MPQAGDAAALTAANGARFLYTGQAYQPDLGMYYYKARMYSPTLGRFMQTDRIGYDDQMDLYAYVANDPVDKTDSTGLAILIDDIVGAVGGAIVGGVVEVGKDVITGEEITTGGVLGAVAGGTLLGEGVVNAPETLGGSIVAAGAAKGAVVGLVTNSIQQGTDISTGAQKGYSVKSAVMSTAVGAVTEGVATKVPRTNVPGLSSGRNNFRSTAEGVRTRIANGNAQNMSLKTAVKGAISGQAADAGKTALGGLIETAKTLYCSYIGFGC